MPRINRSTVRFTVDGYDYEARFFHDHSEGNALMVANTNHSGTLVRHVTDCYLRLLESYNITTVMVGTACCSLKDEYQWKTGIKLSFTRALNQLLAPVDDHELYRQLWGKFMHAFYTESRVKASPTLDAAVAEVKQILGTDRMVMPSLHKNLYKNPDCNIEHPGQSCNVACGY